MPVACPKCKSRALRYSRIRNLSERIGSWFGIRPLRCRVCRNRFVDRTWYIEAVRFARCPRCWRMDLRRWSPKDYVIPAGTKLLLALGGKPYRCEYCRLNFVSFRKRKERYRGRRKASTTAKPDSVELVSEK